jgi:hypothetical protein
MTIARALPDATYLKTNAVKAPATTASAKTATISTAKDVKSSATAHVCRRVRWFSNYIIMNESDAHYRHKITASQKSANDADAESDISVGYSIGKRFISGSEAPRSLDCVFVCSSRTKTQVVS